jgi:hypothetical protein
MQVLTFTAGVDGVKSLPFSCHTEQGGIIVCIISSNKISLKIKFLVFIYFSVPGSPSAVKALLMIPESILG